MKNPKSIKKELEKKHYAFVGGNAAVQICNWTKSALRGEGACWKEKFYGISSAGCCQLSPNVMNCENKCLHCWRPIELNQGIDVKEIFNSKELIDKIILQRKKLMRGFGGNKVVDIEKLEKAYAPSLFTLSLSGEPTLYPDLPELIKEIRSRNAVSFIVTNGQNPEMIKKLKNENALPTQLTLSTNAPNKELFLKWHNSCRKDSYERFMETVDILRKFKGKCRRVIRLTLVKKGTDEKNKLNDIMNMSDKNVSEYAKIIEKAAPNFVHVKGFMSIGYSRPRGMTYDKQPTFDEVKEYAKKILTKLREKDKTWKILADEWRSVVVVLGKDKKEMKIKKV